jgi:hypothetical protein
MPEPPLDQCPIESEDLPERWRDILDELTPCAHRAPGSALSRLCAQISKLCEKVKINLARQISFIISYDSFIGMARS